MYTSVEGDLLGAGVLGLKNRDRWPYSLILLLVLLLLYVLCVPGSSVLLFHAFVMCCVLRSQTTTREEDSYLTDEVEEDLWESLSLSLL